MRNLALLLILLNLAFAAWHEWFAAPVTPAPAELRAANVPTLTLVSELPVAVPARVGAAAAPELATGLATAESVSAPTPAPALAAGAAPAPGSVTALRCLSVGPFRELSQAAAAAANLRAAGYEPVQRVAQGDIWIGYWVYLSGIPTRAQANEILASLQAQGISDSYVTPGDEGFLISLGVFSEVARAGRRREEVRALGQEPNVVDRTRRGTVYWIDVWWPENQSFDLEALQTPGRITRLEQRPCEGG